jgi:hypothetical protein
MSWQLPMYEGPTPCAGQWNGFDYRVGITAKLPPGPAGLPSTRTNLEQFQRGRDWGLGRSMPCLIQGMNLEIAPMGPGTPA